MITKLTTFKLLLENFNNIDIDYYVKKCEEIYDYDEIINYYFEIEDVEEYKTSSPDEYYENLTEIISERFYDIIDDISNCVENTKTIYRSITVSKDIDLFKLCDNPLGIYWTYDKESAEPHWGYDTNKQKIIFTGEIQNSYDVNIEQSILLNLDPNIGEEEKEIRMFVDRPILLISIESNDDIIDINRLCKT